MASNLRKRIHMTKSNGKSKFTWLIPVTTLLLLIGLYFVSDSYRNFMTDAYRKLSGGNPEEIQSWVSEFGAWGFAVIAFLMVLQTLIPFLPSLVIMVVSVLGYGPIWGSALAWGGLLLAGSIAYTIGNLLGPSGTVKMIGKNTENKMEDLVDRYGFWGVIAARISPVISTDAVSLVAGIVKMNYFRFITATAIGTLPLIIAIAWLGQDLNRMKPGLIAISVVSLAVFAIYVWIDRHREKA